MVGIGASWIARPLSLFPTEHILLKVQRGLLVVMVDFIFFHILVPPFPSSSTVFSTCRVRVVPQAGP